MHVRRLLTAAATVAAVVAVPVTAMAGSSTDRATGGGQILLGTKGAGNTVTFTARGTEQAAEGRVTFIDRSGGKGQAQEKFHGIVQCLRVDGNYAEIAGEERDTGKPFNLLVIDNGEGANAENDVVQFSQVDNASCANDDEDDDPQVALGRGNAQVYDASQQSSTSSRKASSKSTTTTSSTSLTSSLLR